MSIPITKRPTPEPMYPCKYCWEDYCWPATELEWSEIDQNWICENCWNPNENGEPQGKLLQTLKAKGLTR